MLEELYAKQLEIRKYCKLLLGADRANPSEDEDDEHAAKAGIESAFSNDAVPDNADKEVADW